MYFMYLRVRVPPFPLAESQWFGSGRIHASAWKCSCLLVHTIPITMKTQLASNKASRAKAKRNLECRKNFGKQEASRGRLMSFQALQGLSGVEEICEALDPDFDYYDDCSF